MNIEEHRFRVLDSWRGICACLVALFHFRIEIFSHLHNSAFISHSWIWVDFFFVLSGFVIFANYEQKLREGYGFWPFMVLRFGRIYPLHFFIITGFVALELLQMVIPQVAALASQAPFGGQDNQASALPAQYLLLHGMGVSDRLSFNFPSWTISAEFYAYALFAALIIGFKKNIDVILPLIVVFAGAFLAIKLGRISATYDFGFFRCIYSFALGALVWRWFQKAQQKISQALQSRRYLPDVFEISMVIVLIATVYYVQGLGQFAVPFVFAAAIMLFTFESGIISRLLLKKPFLLLGALSYSIYMLHNPIAGKVYSFVFRLLYKYFPGHETMIQERMVWGDVAWQGDLIVVIYLLTVVVASVFTYYLIEMPCRNFFRRLVKKRKAAISA